MKFKTARMVAEESTTNNPNKNVTPPVREAEQTLRAAELKSGLAGTPEERDKEDRSIVLTMKHGEKPEVIFNGFWNGRLVQNAMNAISRGYRLRRHKAIRANATGG
jgi:hypothetical protein